MDRKFFLPVLFFILILLALEVLLRTYTLFGVKKPAENLSRVAMEGELIYCPHPLWDHSLNPNVRLKIARGGGEFLYETNSQGFRHPREILTPKPKGVFRVFMLGDSFTEGAAPGPTVTDIVSEVLREKVPSRSFELINAGVASQSLIPYIVRLRRQIFDMEPDLIVVNIDNSDVRDDIYLTPLTRLDEKGIPWEICQDSKKYEQLRGWLNGPESHWLQFLGKISKVFQVLWDIRFRIQEKQAQEIVRCGVERPEHSISKLVSDYSWIKNETMNNDEKKAFSEWAKWPKVLVDLCRRQEVPLVLTTYPHPEQWENPRSRHLQSFLREFSASEDVPFFDAGEALMRFRKEDLYLPDDVHFNTEGTRRWGQALGVFIGREVDAAIEGRS